MTSPLGLKALFVPGGGVHATHSLRFTSGATPVDLLAGCMAAESSLPHTCEALVGLLMPLLIV